MTWSSTASIVKALRSVLRAHREFRPGDAVELSSVADSALSSRFTGLTGTVAYVYGDHVGVRFQGWGRCVVVIKSTCLKSR